MTPTVTAEQAGTYRQVTHKLRVQGRVPETSERPRSTRGAKRYLDLDNPTLITFKEGDVADVPRLLRMGAIETWTPGGPAATPASGPPIEDALVPADELIEIVEAGAAAVAREGIRG